MVFEDKAFQKRIVKPESAGFLLGEFLKTIAGINEDQFTAEAIDEALEGFCQQQEIKLGEVINSIRVAVSGKAAGFGTTDTMAILGKEKTANRIGLALAELENRRNNEA